MKNKKDSFNVTSPLQSLLVPFAAMFSLVFGHTSLLSGLTSHEQNRLGGVSDIEARIVCMFGDGSLGRSEVGRSVVGETK